LVHRAPSRRTCFHARRVDSRSSRSPERTVRLMPSCSRSSSEFLRSHSRPLPFRSRPTARVSFLFATSPGASTCSRTFQALDTFRPQVFSTSRRLSPPPALRACFIPQPRPGHFARSGVLLLCAAAASSSEASCPLAVVRRAALQNESGVHDPAPSASRPSSAPSSHLGGLVVNLPSGHSPLRVSAPPGPILSPLPPAYPGASALEVTRPNLHRSSRSCAGLPAASSSVLSARGPTRASPNESPCPRF